MSVRPTQTKSGYPRRSRQPFPSPQPDLRSDPEAALPVAADPAPPPSSSGVPADPVSRVDRRSQRVARRARRNLAIAVGVLVALCLVLTILIVNMARNRPSGLELLPRSVPAALGAPAATAHPPTVPDRQTRDAPASEGGNR